MSIGSVSSTAGAAAALQSGGMGVQDFMKILLTQLTYQDPLKPMDNQQFMAQMAQFTALQQTQELNNKLDQLISTQASLQSVGLLGKSVDLNTAGGSVSGTVAGLSFAGNSPELTVVTAAGATLTGISLAQVVQVH